VIVHRTQRRDGRGLVRALLGPPTPPGRPGAHVVAASDQLLVPRGAALRRPDRQQLADQMEWPREMFHTPVPNGHAWHLRVGTEPGDPPLGDEQWAQATRRIVAHLGFEDRARAGCRWYGVTRNDADPAGAPAGAGSSDQLRVHVCLIRDDGSTVDLWRDLVKLSQIAHQLEADFGLTRRTRRHGPAGPARGRPAA
jgi:hypothetical protein